MKPYDEIMPNHKISMPMVYNYAVRVFDRLNRRLNWLNNPAQPLKYKYEINRLAHRYKAYGKRSWNMFEPKYPDITVHLIGENGNAFYILGKCLSAMRRANISKEEQDEFYRQATASDYNHLLITCLEWFDEE